MNKRLESVAIALRSKDISADGRELIIKDAVEYRQDAAVVLAISDSLLFAPENIAAAIVEAGYDPAEYLEPITKVINELHNVLDTGVSLGEMKTAWAKGHENGFWDARSTDKAKPAFVFAPEADKAYYTKSDKRLAEAAGYCSGFDNGKLSLTGAEAVLGAQHEEVTNPYREGAQNGAQGPSDD